MRFVSIQDRRYAQFERLSREAGLVHAFSTQPHDVAAKNADPGGRRAANRARFVADWGFSPQTLHYCVQIHEPNLAVVEGADGRRLEGIDGALTAQSGVPLMTFSADCPLVLAYDPVCRVVGMVHSSWRCTVAFSTRRLIDRMRERFGCRPGDVLAGIGPAAGPEQYEVKDDVVAAARELPMCDRLFLRRDGRIFFDLWSANRMQLEAAGVLPENIEVAGICTMTRADLFYSFRREGAGSGHFGLLAGLRCGA